MKSTNEIGNELQLKIKNIPLDIKLFFVFSVLITFTNCYLRLPSNKNLRELTLPYTGWSPDMGYIFFTFFVPLLYLTDLKGSINKDIKRINFIARKYATLMMSILLIFGIIYWILVSPEDYSSTNPYLRYDKLTPIYTIALPLFWILVMAGPLIKYYLKRKTENKNEITR